MQTLLAPAVHVSDPGSHPATVPASVPSAVPYRNPLARDERPRLSSATLRALCGLLDAQLWYWGQDIHHANGNALLRYGFQRVRGPDDGTRRSSAYVLNREHGNAAPLHQLTQLVAWGFGISASHAELGEQYGHLSLVRHEYAPGLCASPLHALPGTRDLLPTRTLPRSAGEWHCLCATTIAVAHCCAHYEAWARRELGVAHRDDAHQRRPRAVRRKNPQPAFLDDAWRHLADRVATESASFGNAAGHTA